MSKHRRVIIESPFAGKTKEENEKNIKYARLCLHDCFKRGEAPFASHLLYTQAGILNDNNPEERRLGIQAGFVWGECAEATIVYIDLGISDGMQKGIIEAKNKSRSVEYRRLTKFKL